MKAYEAKKQLEVAGNNHNHQNNINSDNYEPTLEDLNAWKAFEAQK